MEETKVIKIRLVTYNRIIKLGNPKYQDTMDTIITRILDKLDYKVKPSKKVKKWFVEIV